MSAGQPTPELTTRQIKQVLLWAILLSLTFLLGALGFFQLYPLNLVYWFLALLAFALFIFSFLRTMRVPKIDITETRRLIACQECGVEAEGPFEKGDHVFRPVGSCPRCGGHTYVKALYSIDSKIPLKRQQSKEETISSSQTKDD